MGIEKLVLLEETLIPVYFVIEDDEILEIYNRVKSSTACKLTLYLLSQKFRCCEIVVW